MLTLPEFFARLDQYSARVPLDELTAMMADLDVTMDDVRPYAHFNEETYQRNLMREGPAYAALVLCWRNGQRSPIHDHRGSSCGVRVLAGAMVETTYDRTPDGMIYVTGSNRLSAGQVCGSEDLDIHQVCNLQPDGQDLVTLHVYSPPLMKMGVYSPGDAQVAEFDDPVVGFVGGDGI